MALLGNMTLEDALKDASKPDKLLLIPPLPGGGGERCGFLLRSCGQDLFYGLRKIISSLLADGGIVQ